MTVDSLTVRLGILTRAELESVSPAEQQIIEDSTMGLRRQYHPSWFGRETSRLRWELQLAYGVTLANPV